MRLDNLLKNRLSQFFFITTNKNIEFANYCLKKGIDLPVSDVAVNEIVRRDNGFDFKQIIANICLVIGLDNTFKHRVKYIDIVNQIVKQPEQYCLAHGIEAVKHKNWVDAIGYFKAALIFNEASFDANYHLGRVYYQMFSEQASAKVLLKHAYHALHEAKKIENRAEIDYYLTYVCFHRQAFREAFQCAQAALQNGLSGDLKDDLIANVSIFEDRAKYETGYHQILVERYQEGLETLLSISEQGQDDWRVQFFIGLAYRSVGQVILAIQHYNKARDLNPTKAEIYNDLGVSYMMVGDYKSAKNTFSDGLHKQPTHVELLCNMGIAQINTKQYELAEKFLLKAQQLQPDNASVIAALAELKSGS